MSRSVQFDESVTDTVDVDTDSETDEEVQTVPATEVKSVPVLARPSDASDEYTLNNENNDSPVVVSEPDDSQQATTAPIPPSFEPHISTSAPVLSRSHRLCLCCSRQH